MKLQDLKDFLEKRYTIHLQNENVEMDTRIRNRAVIVDFLGRFEYFLKKKERQGEIAQQSFRNEQRRCYQRKVDSGEIKLKERPIYFSEEYVLFLEGALYKRTPKF